ncbi:HNH endonuclease [Micromonospora sp. STR1_7]|uniref:HNH endonuclease n=1 Tax=Micromonospora parastrephiae TaxID=2806101 RepID=A0ABS1XRL4_9ACTN|nr:HNH endonuclease signature motif containing protein [Micromonospora parastrephiae]MBM0231889.1 HNH endonuclease [Micromonospora parastrephiae]
MVEAGHRCAIPTCRQVPVELAHIDPWSKVQEHAFSNIIALCPTCHTRFDRGEIDRKAMLQYKANLALLNSRYGDLERRVLTLFAEQPDAGTIDLPGGLSILLSYLLQDGLLVKIVRPGGRVVIMGVDQMERYALTERGREFIAKWKGAEPLT